MANNIDQGFWIVLPCDQVKHLPGLRLSPMGVVPQCDRRPRVVIDHSWFKVNAATEPFPMPEVMQFGGTLPRILHRLRHANPKFGHTYLLKVDLSDGFYRMHLKAAHAPRLGVSMPTHPNEPQLIAIPLSCTMGWVNSPPTFCAASKTIADLANARMYWHHVPFHRLASIAEELDQ